MKKIFNILEVKIFERLANDKDTVLFTNGDEIEYIYNKRTGKKYYPKSLLIVER